MNAEVYARCYELLRKQLIIIAFIYFILDINL